MNTDPASYMCDTDLIYPNPQMHREIAFDRLIVRTSRTRDIKASCLKVINGRGIPFYHLSAFLSYRPVVKVMPVLVMTRFKKSFRTGGPL